MEKNIIKRVLHIDGMTCTGCENKIEFTLKKLDGIEEVKAMFTSANVYITYDSNTVRLEQIIDAIEKLDYRVLNNPLDNTPASRNQNDKKTGSNNMGQLLGAGIIIFALYTLIKNTVGFNFIPQVDQTMGFGVLFIVGLLTSLHCIAMCGGINLSVSVRYNAGNTGSKASRLKPGILYNLGRLAAYTLVGGAAGALGSAISFSGTAKGIVAVISGIFMIIMGLNMLDIFPWLRKLNPRLPKALGAKVYSSSGGKGPLFVGLLNGLMPCGPLQAMQLYALGTGSFAAGALSMFLFSLGTMPLMFGFGAISSFLSGKFTHRMLKVSAALVIVLGVIMMNRGMSLSGFNLMSPVAGATGSYSDTAGTATVENGVQVVSTKLEAGRYQPITVQKGIPVRWNILVEAGELNGCNNPVNIPEYNIQKKLSVGDNIIEFTPEKTGNFIYTCWMGMIRSNIRVVENTEDLAEPALTYNDSGTGSGGDVQDSSGIPGGCCAAGSKATEFYNGNIPTEDVAVAKLDNGVQSVTINVNDYGFSPAVAVVQRGVNTVINFNGEKLNSCNNRIVISNYGAGIDLVQGENKIEFTAEEDFNFSCWMGMLNGYIKVVEDINNFSMEDVKKEVDNFVPASGESGGGCC